MTEGRGVGQSFPLVRLRQGCMVLSRCYSSTPIFEQALRAHEPSLTSPLAGKSTLLQILAGKRLTRSNAKVLGSDVFFKTPDGVTYLGASRSTPPPSIVSQGSKSSCLLKRARSRNRADELSCRRDRMGVEPRRAKRSRGGPLSVRLVAP